MGNGAYVKLIKKIQRQIDDVRQNIYSIEDVNLMRFLTFTVGRILYPIRMGESFTQLEEMYNELNQLRGRVRSALNTYGIVSGVEKLEKQEIQMRPETGDIENRAFLSNLLNLSEQINFLEHELRRKDVRYFADPKSNETSKFRQTSINQEDADWEDLRLKF